MWSLIAATHGLVATAPIAGVGARALAGVGSLPLASGGGSVDLGEALQAPGTSLVVLGTYPADFNMIEYAQRLRYYLPALRAKGVSRVLCTVNGKPSSVERLSELIELPAEIELLADESGEAGRAFGCSRGWRPDDASLSPYAKLLGMLLLPHHPRDRNPCWIRYPGGMVLGMLIGLGAWRTLPAVITGYLGNPGGKHGWIEAALAQGQRAGRPTFNGIILDLDGDGKVRRSAFDELPLVGRWGRRPLELATLRLQTMLGVSLASWDELQPTDERCLTQLGGLVAVRDGAVVYEYRDNGICAACDFEELLKAL